MSRYGFSIYGQALYGGPLLSVFSADPVVATPFDYGQVLVTWRAPGGGWDELRVIRNYLGYPASVDNGVEVFSTTPTASGTQVTEPDLKQDHWVYYTVFVHDTVDSEWVRAGVARCFVPSDYGGAARMLALVPEVVKSDTLTKFMGVLGYAYDLLRNDINSMLDLADSMAVSYDLVPLALAQFGIPIEPELEPEQYRRFLRNAAFLYKVKGTEPCIHGLVSAITGWQCTVTTGANLLWTSDYSGLVGGLGGWSASINATIDWVAPVGGSSGALEMHAVATASTAEATINERVPVTVGTVYSAAALARILDAPPLNASLRLTWYDVSGAVLSSVDGTATLIRETVDTVIRVSGTAPTNAVTAALVAVAHTPAAGQRTQWRQFMLNQGAAAPYEPGRDIRISLDITDTDVFRKAVHLDRLSKILPRYLPMGATFTLLDASAP